MPFTKLTNVPVKESMTGNEKIIINDDGVTRQTNIPNYVKTIGGVTPDQNGNVEIELGESWPSDLPKPSVGGYGYTEHVEQTTITWDGNIEGLVSVNIENMLYYKVSNNTPSGDDLIGGRVVFLNNIGELLNKDITPEQVIQVGSIVCTYNVFISLEDNYTIEGVTFPEKGVYFERQVDINNIVYYTKSLTYGAHDIVHKIDKKYIDVTEDEIIIKVDEVERGVWEADESTLPVNVINYKDKEKITFNLSPYNWESFFLTAYCKPTSFKFSENRLKSAVGLFTTPDYGYKVIYKITLDTSSDFGGYYVVVEKYELKKQNESDDMWQSMTEYVDEKLGAIENGSY